MRTTDDTTSTQDALKARLQAELSPEHYALAWKYASEMSDDTMARACDREWELIDEVGRHLPGLHPAVRAIGRHVIEQRPDERGRCCTSEDWV